jgi:hypothetical protein
MTLAEVTVAMGISTIMAVSAVQVMIVVQRRTMEAYWHNESANQSRVVSDRVARDIRGAVMLEAGYGGYTADADTLILKVPSIDADGDPLDVANLFDRIIYRPQSAGSTVLIREIIPGAGSSRQAATTAAGNLLSGAGYAGAFASFPDALGAFVIHFRFTMSRTIGGKTFQSPVSGSVRLRNKT